MRYAQLWFCCASGGDLPVKYWFYLIPPDSVKLKWLTPQLYCSIHTHALHHRRLTDVQSSINQPRKVLSYELFFLICTHMGSWYKFGLVAQTTTLGNFKICNALSSYSRTPLRRPPSESHWCGRIRGMVAREGFIY